MGDGGSGARQDGGWVRNYRRLYDNPVFRSKQQAAVWAWMISEAAWKPREVVFDRKKVWLEEGQLIVGERRVATDFGFSRSVVTDLLDRLEKSGMIARSKEPAWSQGCGHQSGHQRSHQGTIITILKYRDYQSLEDREEPPKQPVEEPQRSQEGATSKEEKKDKEGRKEEDIIHQRVLLLDPGVNTPAREMAEDFAEWWDQVPRKVGKGQAERAYRSARKIADHQTLMHGIMRYNAERMDQDSQYTKHPSTWLNGKCWDDASAPEYSGGHGYSLEATMREAARRMGVQMQ